MIKTLCFSIIDFVISVNCFVTMTFSGLSRLTNAKQGDFYGPAASWVVKKKRLLGIFLLMKAMKIYLIEGERQIKQRDLTK